MKVYRAVIRRRPRQYEEWDDGCYVPDHGPQTSITVHESDGQGKDTGLLDKQGNPLMAFNQVEPIGFNPK